MNQSELYQRDGLEELIKELKGESVPEPTPKPVPDPILNPVPTVDPVERPIPADPEIYTELKKGLKAIVIGVAKYKYYARTSWLPGAKGDAERVIEFLKKDWGMNDSDVYFFTGNPEGNVDRQVTYDAIKRICSEEIGPENNLLFYFAGHGDEIDGDSYLLMSDYASYLSPVEKENRIKMQDLNEIIKECKAKIKVRIFDCCHCGESIVRGDLDAPGVDTVMTSRMLDDFMGKGNGWITFCSCNINESSYDFMHHGIFTDALLNGLRGAARRGKSKLYIEDIKIHVSNVVPVRAKECEDKRRGYDGEQHPQYKCEIDGNILVE